MSDRPIDPNDVTYEPADLVCQLIRRSNAIDALPGASTTQMGLVLAAGLFAIAAELKAARQQLAELTAAGGRGVAREALPATPIPTLSARCSEWHVYSGSRRINRGGC